MVTHLRSRQRCTNPRHGTGRQAKAIAIFLAFGLWVSATALAQLDPSCTASVLNRTVQVNEDGSFFFAGVPSEAGFHRVRVACTPAEGSLVQGQSGLFRFIPNGLVELAGIDFGELTPIPQAIRVEVNPDVLTEPGQRAAIIVTGILSDGTTVDMSDPAEGTEYWVSDERVAALVENEDPREFFLLARERGRVLVGARRDGVVGAVEVELEVPNDADGDGMTDESNLREFEIGSDIFSADTDGIDDGREVEVGTLPNDPGTAPAPPPKSAVMKTFGTY